MQPSRTRGLIVAGLIGLALVVGQGQLPSVMSQERLSVAAASVASVEPLPKGAMHRLGTMRFRHGSRVLCLCYAPNGRLLAAGGGDDPVRLWDADTGLEVRRFNDTWVTGLAFSPRGSVVFTAGFFKKIRMWGVSDGKEIAQLEGHAAPIKAMAVSPDGTMLASGGADGTIILWEVLTRREITRFTGHAGEVTALAFSADNNTLVSASGDRSLRLWDLENGKHMRTIYARCIPAAVVFVDSHTIASGGDDHRIRFFDIGSGRQTREWTGHKATVLSLFMTRDGKTLVSGARDNSIQLWNLEDGKTIQRITRNLGDSDAMALSRDGKYIASAGFNNIIRRWDARTGKEIITGQGSQSPITTLAVSRDGKYLVAGSALARIILSDFGKSKVIREWNRPAAGDLLLAFSPDGRWIASAAGREAILLWDAAGHGDTIKLTGPFEDEILSLGFSPDGKSLAAGHRSQVIRVWDLAQRKVVQKLNYPGPVLALTYAHDGHTLAATGSNQIVLFDAVKGQERRRFEAKDEGASAAITAIAFSPDRRILAAGAESGPIALWDYVKGERIRYMEGHQSMVTSLAFSADGRNLASGSADKTVRLWEVFSGLLIKTWAGHQGAVGSLAIHSSGRAVVSGSNDTTMLVWDVTGGNQSGKTTPVNPAQLKDAWVSLASDNAALGNQVLWDLFKCSKDSVPFLGNQVFLVDPARIKQLLEDLNNDRFLVRERASKELASYGRWVEGILKEELQRPKSEEVRRRLDRLLTQLQKPGSLTLAQERLRVRRVMLMLEQIGSAEARAILEKLTRGAPEEAIRQEAVASLARLSKRDSNGPRTAISPKLTPR
jgi:WD40 repeat protein